MSEDLKLVAESASLADRSFQNSTRLGELIYYSQNSECAYSISSRTELPMDTSAFCIAPFSPSSACGAPTLTTKTGEALPNLARAYLTPYVPDSMYAGISVCLK